MKSAKLTITLHSGKGLKDVKHFGIMNPYGEIWIVGDGMELKHKTIIADKGNCDPVWNYSIHFENVSMNKNYTLFVNIKHHGSMFDRNIGEVQIPFANLLAGDASGNKLSYCLKVSGEQKQGQIILSHAFSHVRDDGASRSTRQVPVAPVRKTGGIANVASTVAEFAAEFAAGIAVNLVTSQLDLDGEDEEDEEDGEDGEDEEDEEDGEVGEDEEYGEDEEDEEDGEYEDEDGVDDEDW